MAIAHAFSSAQSYFTCLICMVFPFSYLKLQPSIITSERPFFDYSIKFPFSIILIILVSSFILLVIVYNCGLILSLSCPYSDLLGTINSKGIDTHSRCSINTWWLNVCCWYQGWNWTLDLQISTCCASATVHFYRKRYWIILPFLHKRSKAPHGLNSTNMSFPYYIWKV